VPKAGTFAAIRAELPGPRLVNFTINTDHELLLYADNHTQGLVLVANALGFSAGRIPFFWALPRERYDAASRAGGKMFPVGLMGASRVDTRVAGTAASSAGSTGSGVSSTQSTQRARPGRASTAAEDVPKHPPERAGEQSGSIPRCRRGPSRLDNGLLLTICLKPLNKEAGRQQCTVALDRDASRVVDPDRVRMHPLPRRNFNS